MTCNKSIFIPASGRIMGIDKSGVGEHSALTFIVSFSNEAFCSKTTTQNNKKQATPL